MIGSVSWVPDGSGLVYMRRARGAEVITFVRRDGRGRKDLVRNANAPLVSPDGKRVAFLRRVSQASIRYSLWIVGTSGGKARKILTPAATEAIRLGAWLSNRELLVQRGTDSDGIFNAGDTVERLDVDSGRRGRSSTTRSRSACRPTRAGCSSSGRTAATRPTTRSDRPH